MTALVYAAAVAGLVLGGLRWLRVAQREHYIAGSCTRFAARWWSSSGPNRLLFGAAVLGLLLSFIRPLPGAVTGLAVAVGPFGLGLRGRTSKLHWTPRLRRLAGIAGAVAGVTLLVGLLTPVAGPMAAAAALLAPVIVDAACGIARPLEARLARPWMEQAERRLAEVAPLVVGITGSYGKTSTKGYVAHLVGGSRPTVATPASFNNQAGLSRAINEHLAPGTEVFVAEMGTYGKGEIAAMCRWVRPTIGVITAIGPVHLERMGSEARIVEAKSELTDAAEIAVLNVDDDRLRALALRIAASGKPVLRCSATDPSADVCVRPVGADLEVIVGGVPLTRFPRNAAQPTNVACAVAVAVELGVAREAVIERLSSLPVAANRLATGVGTTGAVVVDDTFNSNPAGAAAALDVLRRLDGVTGKRVVVTPGMVELGARQRDANITFAAAAAKACDVLVVVGATNRTALVEGARRGRAEVVLVEHREQAVEWVRANCTSGDAVLYENDLPDHYP